MLRRLCLPLLCFVFLLPGCASVPAAAQTPVPGAAASGAFTPHPVAPRPIAAPPAGSSASSGATTTALQSQVTSLQSQLTVSQAQLTASQTQTKTAQAAAAQAAAAAVQAASAAAAAQSQFLAAQAQAAAAQAQQAALNSQVSALNQQLATLTPSPWGNYANPHTDGTHLVFAHYMVCLPLGGVDYTGGTVAGYLAEMQEDAAHGIDGWNLDAGDYTSPSYVANTARIFDAGDQMNALLGGKNNGHGVSHFYLSLKPDFSNAYLESPDGFKGIQNTLALYAGRTSYFHYQGKPFLSTYAGDGGGASVLGGYYLPLLASLKAAGLDPYFVPGWPSVAELDAVDAPGGCSFGPLDTPLGDTSALPDAETLAAAVLASKTKENVARTYMAPITMHWWQPSSASGRIYHEYDGMRGLAAQFDSIQSAQHPTWLELKTRNDVSDGTFYGSDAAGTNWTGLINYNVPGFWPVQGGTMTALDYYIQRYKTSQTPLITTDTLIVSNRCQLAAASQSPTGDPRGPSFVGNPSGWAAGLQNVVSVMAILTHSGFVRLSGVGPAQQQFAPAGVSHLTFYFTQAGVPFAELIQNGQVTKQVYGQPVAATAVLSNLNPFSFTSKPGVKFVITAPVPAGFNLDHAALMCRSTNINNKAMGVCNFAAYDLSTPAPTLFAGSTLNAPASVGQTLDQVRGAGMDAVSQYDFGYGYGQVSLFADPLDATQPPLAYPDTPNGNLLYDFAGKALPSSHVRVHCRIVSTNADPNADGQGGCGFDVRANTNAYFGVACFAYVEKYAGAYTLTIKGENNVASDSNSAGPNILASLGINALAPGEWYDLDVDTDGTTLTATATPSNQQNN